MGKGNQKVLETISKYICQNKLICDGSRLLVALSGGADSVALLHIMLSLGYDCQAVHCNFHLRGDESMRDQHFVESLCKNLNVCLHTTHFDTEEYAKDKHVSIEMAARELRYQYFETLRQDIGADLIAVAHHRDDNVETLLLNATRGTGIKGLRGILPHNGVIIRPLLCISRRDIIDYLNSIGQDYITDSTNLDNIYSRNKVRLDVIPILESINPAASANIATTISNIQEAYKVYIDAISSQVAQCSTTSGDVTTISIKSLQSMPSPISVLHAITSTRGFNRSQETNIISCLDNNPGCTFFSDEWQLLIDRMDIVIRRRENINDNITPLPIDKCDCRIINMSNGHIETDILEANSIMALRVPQSIALMDMAKVKLPIYIRKVRKGDAFVPFGMKGRKLLSDLMTDLKYSVFDKENQFVLCDADDDIIWVIGVRTADKVKVDTSTSTIYKLEFLLS